MSYIDWSRPAKLRAAIPEHQRHISGYGPTYRLLQEMLREARRFQRRVSIRKYGRYVHILDDDCLMSGRDQNVASTLTTMGMHAAGRIWAVNPNRDLFCSHGRGNWEPTITTDEWAPFLIAALDYQATDNSRVADWYLESSCHTHLCARHDIPKVTPCGSGACRVAFPHTNCDCTCNGVNHGMGPEPADADLTPLDWETMPTPVWLSMPAEERIERQIDRYDREMGLAGVIRRDALRDTKTKETVR